MPPEDIRITSRRRFLQYVAASPLLAGSGFAARALEAPSKLPDPMTWAPPGSLDPIKSPKEAINVFDFEPVARANVPPAHFGYMASGIDDEVTLRANREGFLKFQLRPRRLVDVSKVDMSTDILGAKYTARSCWRRSEASGRSMTTARSPAPRRRKPATICRFFRPPPASGSRMSPPRAARRSGTSSTPPTGGRWPRRWSSARS